MNVLAILPGYIPSTIIGVLRPLEELERRGEINLRVRLYNFSAFISHDINWCDVAVFSRNSEINDLSILYELKRKGKKVVYEIDDNFEEIPLSTSIGIYHKTFFRLHVSKRFFFLSDVTRVYSEPLLKSVVSHGGRPQEIRSYFDSSIIEGLHRRAPDGVIRIAYPTGRIDDYQLEERFYTAVRVILEKFSGKVEFHIWRQSLPKQLSGIDGVVLNKGKLSYENFIRSFFQAGFEIGLAPGVDTPFFRSKTNNKYREFGGCGIAGIYSDFPPYSNSVTHEHTGLLTGGATEDWVAAIERLILDEKLRTSIKKNAADDVFCNYRFEDAVQSWRNCLLLLKDKKLDLPEWIPSSNSKRQSFFAYVCLEPTNEVDLRYDYLTLSLQNLPDAILVRYGDAAEYLHCQFRRNLSATIIIISNEKYLDDLTKVLHQSTSAIVDMTTYCDDVDRALSHLREVASEVPITFMIGSEHTRAVTNKDCVLLSNNQFSSITQEFSLVGYPAAYLDVVERHMKFGPEKTKLAHHTIQSMVDYFFVLLSRFRIVFTSIKWRVWPRKF